MKTEKPEKENKDDFNPSNELRLKLVALRDLMDEVVRHKEVQNNPAIALYVKKHMTRNLGVLNKRHRFKSNAVCKRPHLPFPNR